MTRRSLIEKVTAAIPFAGAISRIASGPGGQVIRIGNRLVRYFPDERMATLIQKGEKILLTFSMRNPVPGWYANVMTRSNGFYRVDPVASSWWNATGKTQIQALREMVLKFYQ